ncbi:hypothetical protein LY78DRAFT_302498 [Colletotrichum sublineola]|nr:hypothetical protein LY78DRAFT_302498 [Colletotrichum sublineola]
MYLSIPTARENCVWMQKAFAFCGLFISFSIFTFLLRRLLFIRGSFIRAWTGISSTIPKTVRINVRTFIKFPASKPNPDVVNEHQHACQQCIVLALREASGNTHYRGAKLSGPHQQEIKNETPWCSSSLR